VSAGLAIPDLARRVLLHEMERLSEEYWAAGWYHDLEHILWSWVADPEASFRGGDITEDAAILAWLRDLADGWWVYDPDLQDTRFVTLAEWAAIQEAQP
jgi:hypothetical protein